MASFLDAFDSASTSAFSLISSSSSFLLIGSAFVTVDGDGVNTAPTLTGMASLFSFVICSEIQKLPWKIYETINRYFH